MNAVSLLSQSAADNNVMQTFASTTAVESRTNTGSKLQSWGFVNSVTPGLANLQERPNPVQPPDHLCSQDWRSSKGLLSAAGPLITRCQAATAATHLQFPTKSVWPLTGIVAIRGHAGQLQLKSPQPGPVHVQRTVAIHTLSTCWVFTQPSLLVACRISWRCK